MKKVPMIGKRFGILTVLEEISKSRSGATQYKCLCDCGKENFVSGSHLRAGNTKSCGCQKLKGVNHPSSKMVGDISGDFWQNYIVRSANGSKRRILELTVTKEDVWELFLKQNRKCAISGLDLTFPKGWKDSTHTASLDRIDGSKGYIPGNVQWVHKHINIMRNRFELKYFIRMCQHIAQSSGGACEIPV